MKKFLFLFLFFVSAGNLSAQSSHLDESGKKLWWVNAGAGYGFGQRDQDNFIAKVSAEGSVTLGTKIGFFKLRYSEAGVKKLLDGIPAQRVRDAGLLYLLHTRGGKGTWSGMITAGFGLAAARYEFYSNNNSPNDLTDTKELLGFPFELSAFWTPTEHFGIGVLTFAEANQQATVGGALFSLQVGNLR